MNWAILLIAAYLIGSIPFGLIVGKVIWKKDLRKFGSHNIGATNAWRVLGRKAGLLVFILDFLKGQLGVLLGAWFMANPCAMVLGGLLAMLGHMFPIFLGFRGGKGVATGLGVIAALMPKITAIVFIVWLVIVLITRYVSLGSIVASTLAVILAAIFNVPMPYFIFVMVAAIFIIFRHRDNIKRLKEGRENKV